jgi:hypothetical protein
VKIKIKIIYPAGNFIHLYTHTGNLIMQQLTTVFLKVKVSYMGV